MCEICDLRVQELNERIELIDKLNKALHENSENEEE